MENEALKINLPIRKCYQILRALLYDYSLPVLSEKIEQGHNWIKDGLNAVIHMKFTDKLMLLSALNKKTEIVFFRSQDAITFKIIEGKLKFQTQNVSITLDKGQLLKLDKDLRHRIKTNHQAKLHQIIAYNHLQPTEV